MVQWNEARFRALTRSPAVQEVLMREAELTAQDLRESAPVDSGAYRDSIGVAMKFQDRAVALVVITDPKALILEAKLGLGVKALNRAKRRRRNG